MSDDMHANGGDDSDELQEIGRELSRLAATFPSPPPAPAAAGLHTSKRSQGRHYRMLRVAAGITIAGYVLLQLFGSLPLAGGTPLIGENALTLVTNWIELLVSAAAALFLARRSFRARRGSTSGSEHWSYGWLALACLCWAAGQGVWTWNAMMNIKESPFPSLGDIGFLLAIPLFAAGLLTMSTGPVTFAGRTREFLDGLILALSLFAVTWQMALRKIVEHASTLGGAVAIVYPIGDLLLGSIILAAVVTRRHRGNPVFRLASFAILALGYSDFLFVYQWHVDDFIDGSYIDYGWICCFLLLSLAATHSGFAPPKSTAPASGLAQETDRASASPNAIRRFVPYPYVISPYLIASASLAVIVTQNLGTRSDPVLIADGAAIFALIMARYLAAAMEAERLLRLAYSTQQINADLDIIQSFAGLLILREELPTSPPDDSPASEHSNDAFLDAVERMSRRRQESAELVRHILHAREHLEKKSASLR